MKVCYECSLEKPYSEFYKNIKKHDGYDHICKQCAKCRSKKYLKNRSYEKIEEDKNNQLEYYEKNRERILENKKKYYMKNVDDILQKRKEYHETNSKKIKNNRMEYYKNNSEKIKNKNKINYIENKQYIISRNVRYEMNKRLIDPYYKFYKNLRSRFKNAMKKYTINGKVNSCKEYGINFKLIYEKIGQCPGSDYHLDHIIPLKAFNLNSIEHVRLAHLPENLQWITKKDNMSKKDKIPDLAYENSDLRKILEIIGIIKQ